MLRQNYIDQIHVFQENHIWLIHIIILLVVKLLDLFGIIPEG